MAGARICLGQIGAAHGVRGEVRLRSFTAEPTAIAAYGPLETEDGHIFTIETLRPVKDGSRYGSTYGFVAKLSGVTDRDAAERLVNIKLYVPRERLPEPQAPDEYYHADLVGLRIVNRAGRQCGTVVAIHNFGAGDVIEVRLGTRDKTQMLPFDAATVPEVNIADGRIVVDPSPPAGDGGETKPSRVTSSAGKRPLTPTDAGPRRRRSALSRKGRG
jgi:16S rRNA processing protein RimM